MKLDFGKLIKVIGQVVIAAPAVAAAVKPIVDEVRRPKSKGI